MESLKEREMESGIKIAHCADIHLGMKPNKLSRLSDTRRAEIKVSFFSMLDIIKEKKVELFLIAGDLFHDLNVNNSEVNDVKNALGELNCQVAISPGNHDPFIVESPYNSIWPENVYIFKKNSISFFEMPEFKVRIWGSAFTPLNNSGARILSEDREKLKHDDFINILMVHGTYPAGGTGDDLYNPIYNEDIRESGMNYIALGHIHKGTSVQRSGKTFYAYPGCLDGRSFKETGEKGFYLGTVSKTVCRLDFIKVSKRIYCEINIDISESENSSEISKLITEKIERLYGESYKDNIYRIILSGKIKENFFVDTSYIKRRLEDTVFYAEIFDETEIIYETKGVGIKAIFIKNMNEYIENCKDEESKKIAQKALKLGVISFSKEVVFNEDKESGN